MTPGITAVRRFLAQPKPRRALFVEAWLRLGWARLLLRLISFRRLTRWLSWPLEKKEVSGFEREQLRYDIRWAIERAASWLPGLTTCFPKAMAAQIMCRKRGIDTVLLYGAAVDPVVGLTAHVWVQDGSEGVVGHSNANGYGVLARFPA